MMQLLDIAPVVPGFDVNPFLRILVIGLVVCAAVFFYWKSSIKGKENLK